jgi:drug/metabolite transporter (DMT)-like permease
VIILKYKTKKRSIGIILAVIGASFWGIGGTAADYLFSVEGINMDWFVTARLMLSGILLLGAQCLLKSRREVFHIWMDRQARIPLILFSIFGMLLVQYSYMASIEAGNAAVATLLQYLAPMYIIIWLILRRMKSLAISDVIAVLITIVGTMLLLTNGSFQTLSVSQTSIIWGIISGLSLAFYTLYANRLLDVYSSLTVVGWAMLISGIFMNFIQPVWQVNVGTWTISTVVVMLFGIICGTTLAFWMFITSLKYLEARETTLFGTVEPLTAVISSVIWLNLPFGMWQVIGMILILILIVFLSLHEEREPLDT